MTVNFSIFSYIHHRIYEYNHNPYSPVGYIACGIAQSEVQSIYKIYTIYTIIHTPFVLSFMVCTVKQYRKHKRKCSRASMNLKTFYMNLFIFTKFLNITKVVIAKKEVDTEVSGVMLIFKGRARVGV